MRNDDLYHLPADLPVPVDDASVPLAVVYCYPRTGRRDAIALGGTANWNAIAGARGCTPQSCAYRDHYRELQELGAVVYGLSTQPTDYQREAVSRLHLPFQLLSDAAGELSARLRLPWFDVEGVRL